MRFENYPGQVGVIDKLPISDMNKNKNDLGLFWVGMLKWIRNEANY